MSWQLGQMCPDSEAPRFQQRNAALCDGDHFFLQNCQNYLAGGGRKSNRETGGIP